MNVVTFRANGEDCEADECRVPSIDIDSQGNLIVHYTISGSPKAWTFGDKLILKTWYIIEIKQYKVGNKVHRQVCSHFYVVIKSSSIGLRLLLMVYLNMMKSMKTQGNLKMLRLLAK